MKVSLPDVHERAASSNARESLLWMLQEVRVRIAKQNTTAEFRCCGPDRHDFAAMHEPERLSPARQEFRIDKLDMNG